MEKPLQVFCCYARTDQLYLLELKKRLIPLQRENLIIVHTDIDISPGEEWEQKIHHYLTTAHIILLLVSPGFIASEYCYSNEMMQALERHNEGNAHVIPIILRPVDLRRMPFGKIQSLPTDAKPVSKWANQDDAFLDVANGIEEAMENLLRHLTFQRPASFPQPSTPASMLIQPSFAPPASYLKFLTGPLAGSTIQITKPNFALGREVANDIDLALLDPSVSRHHARIVQINTLWYIEKLAPQNTMTVNSREVQRAPISDSDIISLGEGYQGTKTTFIFHSSNAL